MSLELPRLPNPEQIIAEAGFYRLPDQRKEPLLLNTALVRPLPWDANRPLPFEASVQKQPDTLGKLVDQVVGKYLHDNEAKHTVFESIKKAQKFAGEVIPIKNGTGTDSITVKLTNNTPLGTRRHLVVIGTDDNFFASELKTSSTYGDFSRFEDVSVEMPEEINGHPVKFLLILQANNDDILPGYTYPRLPTPSTPEGNYHFNGIQYYEFKKPVDPDNKSILDRMTDILHQEGRIGEIERLMRLLQIRIATLNAKS